MVEIFAMNALMAVISTSLFSIAFAAAFYSQALFGTRLGSLRKTRSSIANSNRNTLISCASVFFYEILLVIVNSFGYTPHNSTEIFHLTLVMCAIHVLLELPHIGYEARPYESLFIHTLFHFCMTFFSLYIITFYFKIPRTYTR